MKKIIFAGIILLFTAQSLQSQSFYWVAFKDKKGTNYSIDKPEEFLTARALEKRRRFDIQITEQDLPVSDIYVQQLLALDSQNEIHTKSKWLNGVTVSTQDENFATKAKQLPFVKQVELTHITKESEPKRTHVALHTNQVEPKSGNWDYGKAWEQIAQLNAQWLHTMGYKGQGMVLAMHDGGFLNVDKMSFFDSLHYNGRLLGTQNFVRPHECVFDEGTHGTICFSAIAAYINGEFIGTAPLIKAYLFQTEDLRSETPIEEDNWVAALETCDSLGVDVINSSLGYTTFDSLPGLVKRTYTSQNGKTSRATLAASLAASKGIIVCSGNGNSGEKKWRYMGSPADAEYILSVGAVNVNGVKADFSSFGPTADGRTKPDVSARGFKTFCVSPSDTIYTASGTSLSSPVLTGAVTCLWQAFPEKTAFEIMEAVCQSASSSNEPNDSIGYGIPDFLKAYNLLKSGTPEIIENNKKVFELDMLRYSVEGKEMTLNLYSDQNQKINFRIYDQYQNLILDKTLALKPGAKSYKVKLPKFTESQLLNFQFKVNQNILNQTIGYIFK